MCKKGGKTNGSIHTITLSMDRAAYKQWAISKRKAATSKAGSKAGTKASEAAENGTVYAVEGFSTCTCPICLEDCETLFHSEQEFLDSDVGVLSCGHMIHKACSSPTYSVPPPLLGTIRNDEPNQEQSSKNTQKTVPSTQ